MRDPKRSAFMSWLRSILGLDSAAQIKDARERIDRAKRRLAKARTYPPKVAAVILVALALGACKCPPGVAENAANVEAITLENDAALAVSTEPESVKAARTLRNREARTLSVKLVEACK